MSLSETVHGSAVLLGERGILIRGVSGAGKSSLALDLLASSPGGVRLIADDRVILIAAHGRLVADVPGAITGLIEMRGVGLVSLPHVAPAIVRLVVDLEPHGACPRMPEDTETNAALAGIVLPRLVLPIGFAGGAARVRAAIAAIFGQTG